MRQQVLCGHVPFRGAAVGLALFLAALLPAARAQMRTGRDMVDFDAALGLNRDRLLPGLSVTLIATNAPGCIYWPGEQPELTFQVVNRGAEPVQASGRAELIAFATVGIPGDIWKPRVVRLSDHGSVPVALDIPAGGWQNVVLRPEVPERFGGYALVLDLGERGRDFICGLARGFRPTPERIQYPHQSLDSMEPEVLARLGIQAIRKGVGYTHTGHAQYAADMTRLDADLAELLAANVTTVLQFGGGRHAHPIPPVPRTYLADDGRLLDGKGDMCWMPKDDADFEEFAYRILCKHGWPKGCVTGVLLWNEPWEGISISGWGADMLRYRDIVRHLARAVQRARTDAGVDVLLGGCDSSSNTWDKFMPDGSDEFLKLLDFCSIHYQGMSAPVLYPEWNNRKENKGRVLIWDTESWVANTDDRVAGVVASNRAAGYDRALGIFFGNITTQLSHDRVLTAQVFGEQGAERREVPQHAWPAAPAVMAVQHFIGERAFREILFRNGLPWVYVFDGLAGNADDGTLVVLGDLGDLFARRDQVLFRSVRSLAEGREQLDLRRQLDALSADAPERAELLARLRAEQPMRGATLTLPGDEAGAFGLFDFYGNPVPPEAGQIVVPLDIRGFYLRARPDVKGSFARLVEAVRSSRIDGLQPVEIVAHDLLAPIAEQPAFRLTVTNVLNRPVRARLGVRLEPLVLDAPAEIELAAHETRTVEVRVTGGAAVPANAYPLRVDLDAGADGGAVLDEVLHVNRIARRTITVDGKLDDWEGVLPHTVLADERAVPTITEAAWLPFVPFAAGTARGLATGYLAWDAECFYFAVKIADDSPSPGTVRFETRDDDAFFYPEVCYEIKRDEYDIPVLRNEYRWPADVRRYSYRRNPILPDGGYSRFDNVQIAFNAIPLGEDGWLAHLPGRMPKFVWYKCTDYEYALNTVAPQYGGGFEVWRLMAPGMPRKHFYPRQPRHPQEGPVREARLVTVHADGTRVTEAAIPWAEIPHVRALCEAGRPVKFSFAVNHDTAGPVLELAKGRSVSRINSQAFHVDWREHWANEVEFAWEK
jgi:hypothetical protein